MNATHGTVAVGSTSALSYLAILLNGFHGLDEAHSEALAWLIVMGAVGAYAVAAWFVKWKWPTVPPLPGEVVEVPTNTPAIQTAVVQPANPGVVIQPANQGAPA